MAQAQYDNPDAGEALDKIEALEEELRSALSHIAEAASLAIDIPQLAWWLCANHRNVVLDLDGAMYEAVIANATAHGKPPKGDSWEAWVEGSRK